MCTSRRLGFFARCTGAWVLVAGLLAANPVTAAERAPARATVEGHAIPVRVERSPNGFVLMRGGKPYTIRGAGGRSNLERLVAAGGNSIRTWHGRHIGEVLDRAQALGLTVTVGLWLGHERHGADYADANQVARDRERALSIVRQCKDHPAVLAWGIGNEMEGDGRNPLVWKAVNDLAARIKGLDPYHPTMTVIAGPWPDKLRKLKQYCPNIDIVGINVYGDLTGVPAEVTRQGLDRPYVITEFGPFGWWQVKKTSWGAEYEPTSTKKMDTYQRGYQQAVLDEPHRCFGAYAFLWGHKQEHTHTWFGMFLPTGERTPAVDAMTKMWTGRWPENRCPTISPVRMPSWGSSETKEIEAKPGKTLAFVVDARDPDGDELSITWELYSESTDKKSGGDAEQVPAQHPTDVLKPEGANTQIRMPDTPGPYRLFVTARDPHGNAATANIPLLCSGE